MMSPLTLPSSTANLRIRLMNAEVWTLDDVPEVHLTLLDAVGTAEEFLAESRESGLEYDVDDIELLTADDTTISLSDAIDQLARESSGSLEDALAGWKASRGS